jgi:hypothetical protein
MSNKARALMMLWKMGKVTKTALQKAVKDGVLTQKEFDTIVGK